MSRRNRVRYNLVGSAKQEMRVASWRTEWANGVTGRLVFMLTRVEKLQTAPPNHGTSLRRHMFTPEARSSYCSDIAPCMAKQVRLRCRAHVIQDPDI
jgi:hypothetical protein